MKNETIYKANFLRQNINGLKKAIIDFKEKQKVLKVFLVKCEEKGEYENHLVRGSVYEHITDMSSMEYFSSKILIDSLSKMTVHITDELADVVGKGPMPRTEVTKKIWVYIKQHNLQDPQAKRMIKPDAKLAKVLGSMDPIDMFQMTKKLSQHIKEIATSVK